MVTVDPTTMVADLRRRAQKLLDAAASIEEAYGLSKSNNVSVNHPRSEQADTAIVTPAAPGKRRTELIQFLREHGPKRRSEIKLSSGIPVGTISHVLKDGSAFERLEDGTWRAKDNAS